jgi:hypothetical protein
LEKVIVEMANKQESWFSRNDWARTLLTSLMFIVSPVVVSSLFDGSGVVIPAWLKILANVGGCAGLVFTAIKARLADTLSAKIFCFLALAFGWMIAIWQIFELIKH